MRLCGMQLPCVSSQWLPAVQCLHGVRVAAEPVVLQATSVALLLPGLLPPAGHDGTMPFSSGAVSYKSSTTESSTIDGLEEATISCGVTAAGTGGKGGPSTALAGIAGPLTLSATPSPPQSYLYVATKFANQVQSLRLLAACRCRCSCCQAQHGPAGRGHDASQQRQRQHSHTGAQALW